MKNKPIGFETNDVLIHTCTHRFSKLSEPSAMRRQQLEDSLRLQQFCRDTEDGLQWIKEHKPSAESIDFGKSLFGVQNLQKKHQVRSRMCVDIIIVLPLFIINYFRP